jgi:Flp pilus assembly protein TadG
MALMLPALLILALGLFAVARVTGSLLGVTAVTREAARAGVRAPDAETAWEWADARGQQVAGEYGLALENLQLDIDTSSFEVSGTGDGLLTPGEIRVAATYTVDLSDVPLIAWTQAQVPLQRTFAEVVDPYRSAP